ncbi:MAG: molybdate transport system ATP-binding protein [Pseudonocardiales bacterium]|nr:molybdate transport system ATP-binding protein [Pseudonocardiales bacterium]
MIADGNDGRAPSVAADGARAGLAVLATIDRSTFRLDVAFTVAPGEVLGVLGPNGSGKTTLLRALAGLISLSAGTIHLDGQPLDDAATGLFVPPEERPVGLLFQNYRLFPHLSVRDNVAFAPRNHGADRGTARRVADEWLNRLALTELGKRKPAQLSGGQAQRVALARALAANPALLLLDEPLAALDARTKLEVRTELRGHLSAFDGPTLLVTHDPLEAMVMADRLLVLEDGRIVQQGTPAQVARRPATQYVARLVGLNLYPGTRATSGHVVLDDGGTLTAAGLADTGEQPDLPGPADRVLVAIRPSAIALHTSPPTHASPRNIWPGTVAGLELLTDRVRVQITGTPPALVDITPDAVADLHLTEGTPVWLTAKATEVDSYPDPNDVVDARSRR